MTREKFIQAIEEIVKRDAEQRAEIARLRGWQRIVLGTGTDQEAVIRMAADEYTKVAVQCWKDKCTQKEQEIARVREALTEIIGKCEDEDWEYMFGDSIARAKDALKETP